MDTRDARDPLRRWIGPVALLLVLAAGALSLLSLRPPQPADAAAVVSADAAWRHLEIIAAEPHAVGSAAHAQVREYILNTLDGARGGSYAQVQRTLLTLRGNTIELHNIIDVIPGTDATGNILLMTHYDSHQRANGAGDDGMAVAALLEVVRALRERPPLRNNVIVVFTDGEELGLLGARAFVRDHPFASDIDVVLNFEGRGSGGPVLMFETGPDNAAFVRVFQRNDPRPVASSLFPEAYRYLPNDTDFTVFLAAGMRGLNFAHIGRSEHYHRETDVPANASRATLQHHADHAFAMAQAFGNIDLRTLRDERGDAIFFNLPGIGLVRYPAMLALPHAIVACILTLALAVYLQRRRTRFISAAFVGLLCGVSLLAFAVLAGWLAGVVAGWEAEAGLLAGKLVRNEVPYVLGIIALVVLTTLLFVRALGRRFDAVALLSGMTLTLVALGTAAAVLAPGASYLLLWPAMLALAALFFAARSDAGTAGDIVLIVAPLTVAAALWAPHIALFTTGLTLRMAPALGLVVGLALLSLAPVAALPGLNGRRT